MLSNCMGGYFYYRPMLTTDSKTLPVAFLVNTRTYQLTLRLVFTEGQGEYEPQWRLICPSIYQKCHW